MAAGPLRHIVTLQTRQTTQDTFGQVIATWVDGDDVFAKVQPLGGSEVVGQNQVQADVTHHVLMRGRDDVKVTSRVKHKSRILEVVQVVDVEERGIWLELLCKEAVGE